MRSKLALTGVAIETVLVALLTSGCEAGVATTPDMAPVGDGLSVIGLGIVLAAIIGLIGILTGRPK